MAAKEPTVEPGQRAYEAWHEAMGWENRWRNVTDEDRVAWAAAEQAVAERAWDEGKDTWLAWSSGCLAETPVNPYRLPKGSTK